MLKLKQMKLQTGLAASDDIQPGKIGPILKTRRALTGSFLVICHPSVTVMTTYSQGQTLTLLENPLAAKDNVCSTPRQ